MLALALAGAALAGAWRAGAADAVPLPAARVGVEPAPVRLQCPGPVALPQRVVRGDSAFDPAPVAPVVTLDAVLAAGPGAGSLSVLPADGPPAVRALPAGGGTVHLADVDAPLLARAQAGDAAPVAAAVGTSVVTDGDARGLAAASCRAPATDEWIVGGSTAVGSTATLVLVNPGLTVAQVEVELYGPNGRLEPTTAQHVVAPGASKAVDLGGAAADQSALVVRVVTVGGQVAAHVQDTAVRGFTPAGTDLVVAGPGPAVRQVVTGVVAEASRLGSPDAPVLRLLAPGDRDGTATVRLLGADGPVELPGAQEVPLGAGETTDVPLGGLPAGAYTVVVDADVPVVAGAVTSSTGTPGELDDEPRVERAWSPAARVGVHGAVALPRDASARIVVGAVGDADEDGEGTATLRLLGGDGRVLAEHRVRVDVGTTGAWELADLAPGAAGVELEPSGSVDVVWAVALTVPRSDGPLVATLDPVPVPGATSALAVGEDPRPARG